MQLKTTSLLQDLPREKLEVNPFHVFEINTQPTLPETSALGKLELQAKNKKGGQRDILNLKQKNIRPLSVCIHVCLRICLLFCFLIILLKL